MTNGIQSFLALILATVIAVGVYVLLSWPGLLALKGLRKFYPSIEKRKYMLAVIRAVLFAPGLLWSHTPLIIPAYLDAVVLATSSDSSIKNVTLLIASIAIFFMGSIYWEKRKVAQRD